MTSPTNGGDHLSMADYCSQFTVTTGRTFVAGEMPKYWPMSAATERSDAGSFSA